MKPQLSQFESDDPHQHYENQLTDSELSQHAAEVYQELGPGLEQEEYMARFFAGKSAEAKNRSRRLVLAWNWVGVICTLLIAWLLFVHFTLLGFVCFLACAAQIAANWVKYYHAVN